MRDTTLNATAVNTLFSPTNLKGLIDMDAFDLPSDEEISDAQEAIAKNAEWHASQGRK